MSIFLLNIFFLFSFIISFCLFLSIYSLEFSFESNKSIKCVDFFSLSLSFSLFILLLLFDVSSLIELVSNLDLELFLLIFLPSKSKLFLIFKLFILLIIFLFKSLAFLPKD